MIWKFFFVFLSLSGFVFADSVSWKVIDIPRTVYLFRELNNPIGEDPVREKASLQKSHDAVDSMVKEARKLKLKIPKKAFHRYDLKKRRIIEAGLEVVGPNVKKVPKRRIKVRPASKFIWARFTGHTVMLPKVFEELPEYLKKNSYQLKGSECFSERINAIPSSNATIDFYFEIK